MPHHNHDNAHVKQVLQDVLMIAITHMQGLGKEIQTLNPTAERIQEGSEEYKRKVAYLNNLLTVINDVIHPALHIVPDFFPGMENFVELCQKNFKIAVDSKILPAKCPCYMCKIEKPV